MNAVFEALEALDMKATLAINSLHCEWSDQVWLFITRGNTWIPLYIILVALFIWRLGWKRGLIAVAGLALSVACADQLANLVKDGVARLRPCCDQRMIDAGLNILQKPGRHIYGFFSAHAANTMSIAVFGGLALSKSFMGGSGMKKLPEALLILWAVLVGASRIFVGKHFLGDVLVGFAVGAIIACLISRLCFRIPLRHAQRPQER